MKAERESVSVHDRHGRSPGWHGDRPPSQKFALEGRFNRPEQSGGQHNRQAYPETAAPPQAPTKERGNDRTTEWG